MKSKETTETASGSVSFLDTYIEYLRIIVIFLSNPMQKRDHFNFAIIHFTQVDRSGVWGLYFTTHIRTLELEVCIQTFHNIIVVWELDYFLKKLKKSSHLNIHKVLRKIWTHCWRVFCHLRTDDEMVLPYEHIVEEYSVIYVQMTRWYYHMNTLLKSILSFTYRWRDGITN
jgi:hypothetical protein